jgi:hypothetical protein
MFEMNRQLSSAPFESAKDFQRAQRQNALNPKYREETGRLMDLSLFFGHTISETEEKWLHFDPPGFVSRRGVYYGQEEKF